MLVVLVGAFLLPPASGKRFLIISAPPTAVLPHLTDPERLKAWVPRALGVPNETFEVLGEGTGDALDDRESEPTDREAGDDETRAQLVWRTDEGLGQISVEPARVDRAARLRLSGPDGSERIWRFRFGDAGRYGLALTVFTTYRPAGLFAGVRALFGRDRRARALERGLSLLRGSVLADFGQGGGSFRPPGHGLPAASERLGGLDRAQPMRAN